MLRIIFWAAIAGLFTWLFLSSIAPMTQPSVPLYVALGALGTYLFMTVLALVEIVSVVVRRGVRGILLRPVVPIEREGHVGRVAKLAQRRIRLVR